MISAAPPTLPEAARPEWLRDPRHQCGGKSAGPGLLFEMAVKLDAHVDACTRECAADHTVYNGALEAGPRLLKQIRNFLLHQPAPGEETFQDGAVRRCDARTADRSTGGRLVSRFRSSPVLAARFDANFGIEGH